MFRTQRPRYSEPMKKRITIALADAYQRGAQGAGHEVKVIHVARLGLLVVPFAEHALTSDERLQLARRMQARRAPK